MGQKIDVQMPEGMVIGDGWHIVWAAVDPTTGADVANVIVTNANVVATEQSAASDQVPGPFMLVPGPNA